MDARQPAYCAGAVDCAAVAEVVVVEEAVPKPPRAPSMTSGVSGFMLSISFSTGMTARAVGIAADAAAVLVTGVCIAPAVLVGRNFSG